MLCEIGKISPIYTHEVEKPFLNARVLLDITYQFRFNYFRQMKSDDGGCH